MKKFLFLISLGYASTLHAGGSIGGGGLISSTTENILKVGDNELVLGPSFESKEEVGIEREKLLEIISNSLAKKPLTLNGELLKADKFDFEKSSLVLRSLQDPKRAITIKEIAEPAE